jgi:UPF0271 protein
VKIDLNSDLGEGYGVYALGDDAGLLDIITSANVACGYHAGDPVIMDRTVRLALARGVDLGAHVSYPDLIGFGRRPIQMNPSELEKHVLYQLGALYGIATAAGHRITHVNAHGALGNQVCADRAVADTLVRAVLSFDRTLKLLVLPGTEIDRAARDAGLLTANVFLADRAYDDAGQLVARKIPGSVIKDVATVLQRVRQLLKQGTITTISGKTLTVSIQSILVHSDTPDAVKLAATIRTEIEAGGGQVVPLSQMTPMA